MKSHGLTMYGDFNTNNIKSQNGTDFATLSDTTGEMETSASLKIGSDFKTDNIKAQDGRIALTISNISGDVSIKNDLTIDGDLITDDIKSYSNIDAIAIDSSGNIQIINDLWTDNIKSDMGISAITIDKSGNVTITSRIRTSNISSKNGLTSLTISDTTGKVNISKQLQYTGSTPGDQYTILSDVSGNCIWSDFPSKLARQTSLDDHAALTNPHSATSSNIANRLVLRDTSGRIAIGNALDDDHAINLGQLHQHAPTGMIAAFFTATAPYGFLECNGAKISRVTYASLFDQIGTLFGGGDGSTTFNLPDLRGEFLRGWDHGRGVDVGRPLATFQAEDFKSHNHSASIAFSGSHVHSGTVQSNGGHAHNVPHCSDSASAGSYISGNAGTYGIAYNTATSWAGDHTHNITVNVGGDHTHNITVDAAGGTETRPRNYAVMFCIKYI